MSWRRRRIGLDLDKPSRLELMRAYWNAKHFFPDSKVELKRTGKGYHIRIHKKHELKENLDVRRALLDDPNRIKFDEKRIRHPKLHGWVDTLFKTKKRNGQITKEKPYSIMMDPFWSRLPCRKT